MTYRMQKYYDLIDETDIAWNMLLNNLLYYFNNSSAMEEKERRFYNNKLCSELAVIAEKYSKALYLRSATIPENVVNRLGLNDDEIVNIIIGSDDSKSKEIYGKLTKEEKKDIQLLKFQGISHNFTKLLNSNNAFLKDIQFYFNLSLKSIKVISDEDLDDVLFSDKVYDAFVKGRYSSLNGFNADFDALISLCEVLQSKIIDGEEVFDMNCVEILTYDFDLLRSFYNYRKSIDENAGTYGGYQPRFRMIKHIHPVLGSTITVENGEEKKDYCFGKHKSVSVYKYNNVDGIYHQEFKNNEELISEIERAPEHIGLFSLQEKMAESIIEFNDAFNMSGLVIPNEGSVTFFDNSGQHTISNKKGQLIFVCDEKDNKKNNERVPD